MADVKTICGIVLAATLLVPGATMADEEATPTLEPEGVSAGKPYQVRGTLEWVDVGDQYLVVDGVEYHYQLLRVHGGGKAASLEVEQTETRLQPGMKVGLATGGGNSQPVLEVWVLQ